MLITTEAKAKAMGWKPKAYLRNYTYVAQVCVWQTRLIDICPKNQSKLREKLRLSYSLAHSIPGPQGAVVAWSRIRHAQGARQSWPLPLRMYNGILLVAALL